MEAFAATKQWPETRSASISGLAQLHSKAVWPHGKIRDLRQYSLNQEHDFVAEPAHCTSMSYDDMCEAIYATCCCHS